jgi:hypothetical protein
MSRAVPSECNRNVADSCHSCTASHKSYHIILVGGFNPSEKYEFVSWDDDIPYYYDYMESHKIHVPNHQPVYIKSIQK